LLPNCCAKWIFGIILRQINICDQSAPKMCAKFCSSRCSAPKIFRKYTLKFTLELSLWEETGVLGENPRLRQSVDRLFSHDKHDLINS
jgi:hypothetical protein